jgi:hypothetical protein
VLFFAGAAFFALFLGLGSSSSSCSASASSSAGSAALRPRLADLGDGAAEAAAGLERATRLGVLAAAAGSSALLGCSSARASHGPLASRQPTTSVVCARGRLPPENPKPSDGARVHPPHPERSCEHACRASALPRGSTSAGPRVVRGDLAATCIRRRSRCGDEASARTFDDGVDRLTAPAGGPGRGLRRLGGGRLGLRARSASCHACTATSPHTRQRQSRAHTHASSRERRRFTSSPSFCRPRGWQPGGRPSRPASTPCRGCPLPVRTRSTSHLTTRSFTRSKPRFR